VWRREKCLAHQISNREPFNVWPVAILTRISWLSHVGMHVTKYIKLKPVEDNVKLDRKETEYENVDESVWLRTESGCRFFYIW
jgi:hypothetical protein